MEPLSTSITRPAKLNIVNPKSSSLYREKVKHKIFLSSSYKLLDFVSTIFCSTFILFGVVNEVVDDETEPGFNGGNQSVEGGGEGKVCRVSHCFAGCLGTFNWRTHKS
jgi:hypothetical protein